ncbi:lysozyme [Leisingera sp. ANG-M7]|uniref:lysozyme n=1 Tax=Leisingera sp. ANG-M7 TaxID=1577902 RepID=UPI0005807F9D|nr:hypothetical protein [Leisingera sp. ANG-M7]KIC39355.1 hypothetical protein RA26_01495 [Leisingera sp. ANG-M7]
MLPKLQTANVAGNALAQIVQARRMQNALAEQPTSPQYNALAAYGGPTREAGDALSLLREFEGFSNTPYWDVNAYRAGYGSDTITTEDGRIIPVRQGMSVDRAGADRDLSRRVSTEFEPSVVRAIGQERYNALDPQQRAALVSLAYNYGAGAWNDDLSGVARAVRSGGDVRSAISSLASHNDGVNKKRRLREASFF